MASKDDQDVMETNLDKVQIDEDGNLQMEAPSVEICLELEGEASADGIDVDEDGNIRIQSAGRLLETSFSSLSGHASEPDDFSAKERESLRKRQSDKQAYARYGTDEEEKGMLAAELQRNMNDGLSETNGARPQSRDVNEIELCELGYPHSEPATESHQSVEHSERIHSLERGEASQQRGRVQHRKGLRGVVDIISSFFTNASPQRLAIFAAVVVVVIGILLTVSLLPASFVYVEYHELALAKNRVSGKVNREDVYYPGCYLLTPDVELVRFQGTAHFVDLTLDISTSDKLSFNLGISLQYFIKPEELGLLFTNYEHDYKEVVEAMIISSVKNEAVDFSLDHFRLNRSSVEQALKQAVAFRLSGNCCPSCCPWDCSASVDCRSCRLAGRGCYQGVHMQMRYFQMGAVDVPAEVSERFLRQTILLIEAEKEVFVQEHAVQTKMTEQMQKDILNQAAEIREVANAEANKTLLVAQSNYEKEVQTSYFEALKKLYQRLNITQEDHKLSLMYVRALDDISDNLYNLNFEKMTTFN